MRAYANSGALKTGSVATIYFAARGPYVKIGISRDPAKRLRALRYGRLLTPPDADTSAPIELLHTIPGCSLDDEFRMQMRFSDWLVVGEWFRGDVAFLDELAAVIAEAQHSTKEHQMSGYNGNCACEDCTTPTPPTPHLPRLEAEGDAWGAA